MPTRNSRASVLDDVGDPDAPPGSQAWARWMLGQAKLSRSALDRDVTGLRDLLSKLQRHRAWEALGFASLETLCRAELAIDTADLDAIRTAKPGTALRAVLGAHAARPLAGHGEVGNGRRGDNITSTSRGMSAEYLTARIARDHPAILARMKAGEFRSVRAAAVEAGIVKVPTAYDAALKAVRKLTAAERRRLLKALQAELGE